MSYLVDTNILSELARPAPNAGVVSWAQRLTRLALSVVTVDEIYFGLSWKPNHRIRAWFDRFVGNHCDVLPITDQIARRSGRLRGRLRGRGRIRTQADMLIAATADVHELILVTRNEADFEDCGLPLLNPFSASPPNDA